MSVLWGLSGFLPLILYALIIYGLVWRFPRWLRSLRNRAPVSALSNFSPADSAPASGRKRAIGTLTTDVEPRPQPAGIFAAGAVPNPDWPPVATDEVIETISVVIRRQIPPRFDEPVRSWIGGLPQMPEGVEWPRSISSESPQKGERPLHFLAQICCADLPTDLWGGLGPREGWLLLFADPNQGCPEGPDAFRVLHIDMLGPERPAPFDLGPVHDGLYSGPSYDYLLPDEPVPTSWRRWPVDLVTVPNEAREESGRTLVAPENFAQILYEGAPVASGRDLPAPPRPLTFGQALYPLAALRRRVNQKLAPVQMSDRFVEALRVDGAIDAFADRCGDDARHRLAAHDAQGAPAGPADAALRVEIRARLEANVSEFDRMAQWLRESATVDGLARYFDEAVMREQAWQDRLLLHIDAVTEAVRAEDPDLALSQQDWEELVASFEGHDFARWTPDRVREIDGHPQVSFREHKRSAELFAGLAMHQLIANMYLDPDRRPLLPPDIVAEYEPHWRVLYSNRPHRIGGYHDGLQSDAVIGPAKDLLLFQIASDDAMQWMWGDGGAYYFWIRPKHLKSRDFSGVEMWLECH